MHHQVNLYNILYSTIYYTSILFFELELNGFSHFYASRCLLDIKYILRRICQNFGIMQSSISILVTKYVGDNFEMLVPVFVTHEFLLH